MRTSKTVDGVVYNYYYAGSQLVRMTYGDYVLDFFYNANGTPIAMRQGYASNSNYVVYYYITNLQGDVIRLVDVNGSTAAYYEYDPYGNAIQAAGSHATINPLRYRGYVYDNESGFYYLQSRYYDPKICRFINADSFASTGQGILGINMFAYCRNNPVTRKDASGAQDECVEDFNEDDNPLNDLGNPSGSGASCGNSFGSNPSGSGSSAGGGNSTCKVIGGGHGNIVHNSRIENHMSELAASGQYSAIYGNRSLKTAGQVGNQRPDVIAIGKNGVVQVWEFASPSQATGTAGYAALQLKIGIMQAANPSIVFNEIVPW